jgi:hypothetical protein
VDLEDVDDDVVMLYHDTFLKLILVQHFLERDVLLKDVYALEDPKSHWKSREAQPSSCHLQASMRELLISKGFLRWQSLDPQFSAYEGSWVLSSMLLVSQ